MEKGKNTVSVAMAVYNGEQYICEQIESILPQLRSYDELVISYDRSTDCTLKIIKEYAQQDLRIKIYQNAKQGVVKNFQNAVSKCIGDIIFFSDQDDIWLEGKIERVRKAFDDEKVTAVIHDTKTIDNRKNVVCKSTFDARWGNTSVIRNLIRLSYIGCAMAFRKEMIPIILPFPTKERSHDWWTGTMCGIFGKIAIINEVYILHRFHEENVTPKKRPGLKYQLSIRWIIITNAIKRCIHYRKILKIVNSGTPLVRLSSKIFFPGDND